jgi:opacity protein-like surface antigen
MRYDFDTGLDLVPYAGAGLGIVTKGTEAEVGGTVAGRATAGFDLNLAAETAVFAEYAFMKSGGVAFGNGQDGAGQTVPDNEHSLKLGFRRQF